MTGAAAPASGTSTAFSPCSTFSSGSEMQARHGLNSVIKKYKTSPQSTLISHLNPIIRGWANYYSGVVSTDTFNKLDYTIWLMLRAWTVSRCGKANYKKLSKYFGPGTVKLSNGKERHNRARSTILSTIVDNQYALDMRISVLRGKFQLEY